MRADHRHLCVSSKTPRIEDDGARNGGKIAGTNCGRRSSSLPMTEIMFEWLVGAAVREIAKCAASSAAEERDLSIEKCI